ncbi:MAG: hypothetical protein ACP5D2_03610, partial [Candidatus Nanoarchaeia archaeon]
GDKIVSGDEAESNNWVGGTENIDANKKAFKKWYSGIQNPTSEPNVDGGDGPETPTGEDSFLAGLFGLTEGSGPSALVSGLQWAGTAYLFGQLAGGMFGLEDDNKQALSTALASGAFVYKSLMSWKGAAEGGALEWLGPSEAGFAGANTPFIMGVGVAAVVFLLSYKDKETMIIEFQCQPWQAPTGADNCEMCNEQEGCSEYQCKSLGQNCELVNQGTEEERCVSVDVDDATPPTIKPDENVLTEGYKYADVKMSPPGPGFKIQKEDGGCIEAFTPVRFGLITDEPAQCKIDYNATAFDDMAYYVGNNLYKYNHTEQLSLPGPAHLENLTIKHDGKFTLYTRCRDKNGNVNEAEYAIQFCVDPTPDNTAPQIKATSINNAGCVASNKDSANVEFYVNEPAQCRWSHQDQSYENMNNEMECDEEIYEMNSMQLYTCQANLTGIARDATNFYVRCKDQPNKPENERNVMAESYKFSLRGSQPLKLTGLKPNETVYSGINPAPLQLRVETLFGCQKGRSICYYSNTGEENSYIMFYDTDNEDGIHTQRLDLEDGEHTYYVKCVDEGGNVVKSSTTFNVEIDTSAPTVARVYREADKLKLITVRKGECSYSLNNCDFLFEEGIEMPYANSTEHVVEWDDSKTYYIKCRDDYREAGADCSIIVKPSRLK